MSISAFKKMKRASNKPKRHAYVDADEYQRDLKRWKRQQNVQYKNTPPSQLSNPLLATILSENDILQSGCREIREWRLEQFRKELPVKQSGHHRPNLTRPTRLDVVVETRFILSLPRDVWTNIIFTYLSENDLFQLQRTCKTFYVVATELLFCKARAYFKHERATPLALSLCHRIADLKYDYQRANLLKLSNRVVRKKRPDALVFKAIEKHGYIEHLRDFSDFLERKRQAEDEEEQFTLTRMPVRSKYCSMLLKDAGYTFDFFSYNRDLMQFIGDFSYFRELQAYVYMEDTRVPQAIVNDLKHPLIYQTLEHYNLKECVNRYALAYLLDLISNKHFMGRTLSDFQIVHYAQSIVQMLRYQGSTMLEMQCCVWGESSVNLLPIAADTRLVYPKSNLPCNKADPHYWWMNHTDYHSYHFIGP
jgi:hypothetical protein